MNIILTGLLVYILDRPKALTKVTLSWFIQLDSHEMLVCVEITH